jgi:lysozyme family protein
MENPIDTVLRHEGGYVNNKADSGGATNFGITRKTLSHYLGRKASIENVRSMTESTAREIYERNYLTGPRINTLPEPTQTLILDMAVTHGPRNGIKILQRVLNASGVSAPISPDGIMGPTTREATELALSKMGNTLQNALVEERIRFFHNIVNKDSSQKIFLGGWVIRAESFKL